MHSNKMKHNSISTSNFQQNSNILVLANSILTLEKNVKIQAEQISKLKDQFNQLFRCAVDQQQPPQSPKPSRVNRNGYRSNRTQPYLYPLQKRQPALPAANQFGLTEQNSFHHLYAHTLRSPQPIPSDTQGIDHFDFIAQHNLSLQQQQQPVLSAAQVTDQFGMTSTHHLQPAQGTGQFGPYHTLRSPLPKQQPIADKYGLMTVQDQPHYHTHPLQSPLSQQQLLNPSSTQTTDQFGQNSPYHDTHTLRSPLPNQQPVFPTEATDQFGHLMLGQIPNPQQLTSHMICGETYPFPSDSQPREFDYNDGDQKNK
jgi:hypothetical protein